MNHDLLQTSRAEWFVGDGYTPVADQPKEERRYIGTVSQVDREEQTFLVAVSRDAEEIGLQEMRADAYDKVE